MTITQLESLPPWLAILPGVDGVGRNGKMHARGFNALMAWIVRSSRFEGALIVHLIVEIAGRPVGLSKKLKAQASAVGHDCEAIQGARCQAVGGTSTDLPSVQS